MTRSQIRLMVAAAILCLVAAPYVLNPFSITLLNYIGIYSLAAIGLALLTGSAALYPSARPHSSASRPTRRPGHRR